MLCLIKGMALEMLTSSKEDFHVFGGQKWTDMLVSLRVGDDLS